MAKAAKMTTDHEEIRSWAESHGGRPASAKGTGKGEDPGVLRIDFPGFSGEDTLKPLSWEQFFEAFDANKLALLYRPEDRFNKLVSRRTAAGSGQRGRAGGKSAAPQAAARRPRTAARSPRAKKSAAGASGTSRAKAAPKGKSRANKGGGRRGQRSKSR